MLKKESANSSGLPEEAKQHKGRVSLSDIVEISGTEHVSICYSKNTERHRPQFETLTAIFPSLKIPEFGQMISKIEATFLIYTWPNYFVDVKAPQWIELVSVIRLVPIIRILRKYMNLSSSLKRKHLSSKPLLLTAAWTITTFTVVCCGLRKSSESINKGRASC